MIFPLIVWFEGGSKKNVLFEKIGLRANADTSVCF